MNDGTERNVGERQAVADFDIGFWSAYDLVANLQSLRSEGKSPVGRKRPVTPWGKPAYGVKTRDNRKASTKLIVKRRK